MYEIYITKFILYLNLYYTLKRFFKHVETHDS